MSVVKVYSRLYGECLRQALVGVGKNAWTLLLPMLMVAGLVVLMLLVRPLGFFAGFAYALGSAALFSGYLYFVGEIVAKSRVKITEFRRSIGAYFWSVVNLAFVLWLVQLILGFTVGRSPQGPAMIAVVNIILLIAINAAPEVIYQRRTYGGMATIQSAFGFLQENWLEWIIPNLPLFAAGYLFFRWSDALLPPLSWVVLVGAGALLHVAFVFRGFVFAELDGSSHRQRMFQYRNQ